MVFKTSFFSEAKLKPRDGLFWFNKPELLLSLIHFILFQWQFGYRSCFIRNHLHVYLRLILGSLHGVSLVHSLSNCWTIWIQMVKKRSVGCCLAYILLDSSPIRWFKWIESYHLILT